MVVVVPVIGTFGFDPPFRPLLGRLLRTLWFGELVVVPVGDVVALGAVLCAALAAVDA